MRLVYPFATRLGQCIWVCVRVWCDNKPPVEFEPTASRLLSGFSAN